MRPPIQIPSKAVIFAFIQFIAVFALQSAFADTYWEGARERLRELRTWDELCAVEDCTQFPDGYATYQIGPHLYYLPHYNTLTVKPPAVYGVRPGRFEDVSEDGELIRSFGHTGGYRLSHCCHYVMEFHGLAETFPFKATGSLPRMVAPAILAILPYDVFRSNHNGISLIDGAFLTEGFFPSIEDVFPDGLSSYDENFWLIDVQETQNGISPAFQILSKRPLLSGRHVFAHCTTNCSFSSMSFAQDRDSVLPHINIRWFSFPGDLFNCDPVQIEPDCRPAPDFFAKVPLMLRHYDELVERFRIQP